MARPFSVRRDDRTIYVGGELDLSTASLFEAHVDGITEQDGDIVVDASELAFIDSSGIRVVFGIARRLGARGRLVIVNPTDQVRRVLDLVHGESLFDIRERSTGV